MLCAFSKFHSEVSPVLSGMLDFKSSNSSIYILFNFYNPSQRVPSYTAMLLKVLLQSSNLNSMSLSLGSFTSVLPYTSEPGRALLILLLMNFTCVDINPSHVMYNIIMSSYTTCYIPHQCISDPITSQVLSCVLVNVHQGPDPCVCFRKLNRKIHNQPGKNKPASPLSHRWSRSAGFGTGI